MRAQKSPVYRKNPALFDEVYVSGCQMVFPGSELP
jgi:hypothetical protein